MITNDLRRDDFINATGIFVTPRFFEETILPSYKEFTDNILMSYLITEGTTAGVYTDSFVETNEAETDDKLHIIGVENTDIKIILEDISNVMAGRNDTSVSCKNVLEGLVRKYNGQDKMVL